VEGGVSTAAAASPSAPTCAVKDALRMPKGGETVLVDVTLAPRGDTSTELAKPDETAALVARLPAAALAAAATPVAVNPARMARDDPDNVEGRAPSICWPRHANPSAAGLAGDSKISGWEEVDRSEV
jgi:hypothetical protein